MWKRLERYTGEQFYHVGDICAIPSHYMNTGPSPSTNPIMPTPSGQAANFFFYKVIGLTRIQTTAFFDIYPTALRCGHIGCDVKVNVVSAKLRTNRCRFYCDMKHNKYNIGLIFTWASQTCIKVGRFIQQPLGHLKIIKLFQTHKINSEFVHQTVSCREARWLVMIQKMSGPTIVLMIISHIV